MGALNGRARSLPSSLPPLLQALFSRPVPTELPEEEDPFKDLKTCPVVTYCETTLLQLPWASLEPAQTRRPRQIRIELNGELSGSRPWRAFTGGRVLPGPFEREVFRALEWMALEKFFMQGRRFENPLLFQIPEICERLCLKELSTNFRAIDRAIRLLAEVEIERPVSIPWTRPEKLAAPLRRDKLIDRIAFDPRPGPHRRPAFRRHALFFGRLFVDSVNAGGIRAVNWGVWMSLRQPFSRRLMEVLDFESAPAGGRRGLLLPLDRLARLLPLKGALGSETLRPILERAHEELVSEKYLEGVEWTSSKSEPSVVYHPGVAQTSIARVLRRQGLPVPPLRALASGRVGTG